MNKKITIVLSGAWVLGHRQDDMLPIQFLVNLVKKKFDGKLDIVKSNLTELHITVRRPENAEELSNQLRTEFCSHYELEENSSVMNFTVEDVTDTPAEPDGKTAEDDAVSEDKNGDDGAIRKGKGTDDKEGDSDLDREEVAASSFLERLRRSSSDASEGQAEGKEAKTETPETCMARINTLIGAEEFKALANEICCIAPQIRDNRTYEVFASRGFVFSVNVGYGLSTYLKELATLMGVLGLRKGLTPDNILEARLDPPKADGSDSFGDIYRLLRFGKPEETHLLCVDISEWMNALNTPSFRGFLDTIAGKMNEFVVVFRVPFVDKDVLERVRFALNDVLFVRMVSVPPFNGTELRRYAEAEIARYGFRMSRAAWSGFDRRINEEKSDGKFYGVHTVVKVVRELLYAKQLDNARRGKNDKCLSKRDTSALCAERETEGLSAMEMLDRLVGNDAIKGRILEIVSQIVYAHSRGDMESPCIHMRFVGNPGTGKTTVARIIGKLLKEQGVLRIGDFHEHAGRDLCGRYIGETAPKTSSICRDAYGSVLFLDEAYTLYRGDGNDRDYGREALDTLIAEMENHRNDMVIIMAGYADEMEILMHGNAGLASRMPYVIEFPNFTRDQLYEIFVSMMGNRFKYEEALLPAVKAYFDGLPDTLLSSKEFSNARFVRNLFERTWAKASMRCQLSKISEITLTKDDFDRSTQDREFKFMNEKKKNRIGFYE